MKQGIAGRGAERGIPGEKQTQRESGLFCQVLQVAEDHKLVLQAD